MARSGRRGSERSAAAQAAYGLAALAEEDPAAMVTACRLLMEKNPGPGCLHETCRRMLDSRDPVAEAERIVQELGADPVPFW